MSSEGNLKTEYLSEMRFILLILLNIYQSRGLYDHLDRRFESREMILHRQHPVERPAGGPVHLRRFRLCRRRGRQRRQGRQWRGVMATIRRSGGRRRAVSVLLFVTHAQRRRWEVRRRRRRPAGRRPDPRRRRRPCTPGYPTTSGGAAVLAPSCVERHGLGSLSHHSNSKRQSRVS